MFYFEKLQYNIITIFISKATKVMFIKYNDDIILIGFSTQHD